MLAYITTVTRPLSLFLTVFVALLFTIATVLQLPGQARQAQAVP